MTIPGSTFTGLVALWSGQGLWSGLFECVLSVWACIYLQATFEITRFGFHFWLRKAERCLLFSQALYPMSLIKQVLRVFCVDDLFFFFFVMFCFRLFGVCGSCLALKSPAFILEGKPGSVRRCFGYLSWTLGQCGVR